MNFLWILIYFFFFRRWRLPRCGKRLWQDVGGREGTNFSSKLNCRMLGPAKMSKCWNIEMTKCRMVKCQKVKPPKGRKMRLSKRESFKKASWKLWVIKTSNHKFVEITKPSKKSRSFRSMFSSFDSSVDFHLQSSLLSTQEEEKQSVLTIRSSNHNGSNLKLKRN